MITFTENYGYDNALIAYLRVSWNVPIYSTTL